jgi:hypothetical protein
VPEKATPAKPEAAKEQTKKDSRKKLFNLIENGILVFGFLIMFGSIFLANEVRPIVAGTVNVIVAPITATMPSTSSSSPSRQLSLYYPPSSRSTPWTGN